jgi:hypothetical protein
LEKLGFDVFESGMGPGDRQLFAQALGRDHLSSLSSAKYRMRMSSVPSMLYVGMHALTGTRGVSMDRKIGRLVFLQIDILVFDDGETARTLAHSSSRDLRR